MRGKDKKPRRRENYKGRPKGVGPARLVFSVSISSRRRKLIEQLLIRRGIIPTDPLIVEFSRGLLYGEIDALLNDNPIII